jgi:hypothetical protein
MYTQSLSSEADEYSGYSLLELLVFNDTMMLCARQGNLHGHFNPHVHR